MDILLTGGPADIPETVRMRREVITDRKIKIRHRAGYEHFEKSDTESRDGDPGPVVFRWIMRTSIAE
ncbi:DUF5988 family protein [Actinomadura pelletieri]|uniref:DUF5988 family protein n=1 Tax=Actinomadura pelletieri TaxID=111805 RepID=UPI001B87A030|nr:DUF5988 family protein [Actinomadura pelletieri]